MSNRNKSVESERLVLQTESYIPPTQNSSHQVNILEKGPLKMTDFQWCYKGSFLILNNWYSKKKIKENQNFLSLSPIEGHKYSSIGHLYKKKGDLYNPSRDSSSETNSSDP